MSKRVLFGLCGTFMVAACAGPPAPSRPRGTAGLAKEPNVALPPQPVEIEWLPLPASPERALAWSNDHRWALLTGRGGVSLWETASGRAVARLGYAHRAAFSPSASHFALERDDGIVVMERVSLRAVGTVKRTPRDRLVTVLEEPLRVATQFETQRYGEEGSQRSLKLWGASDGKMLSEADCDPIAAVSPDRRKAVTSWQWRGVVEATSKLAQIVAFPSCRELAGFSAPFESGPALQVSHAAFASDSQHAFATLGPTDVNGRAVTRTLLRWQGDAKLESVATFAPQGDREFDFDELRVDAAGQQAALVNVETFVPRSCVSCRSAEADSIGYSTGFEDFRAFDGEGKPRAEPTEGFGGPAFFPGRKERVGGTALRLRAFFRAPSGVARPLYAGEEERAPSRDLQVGPDWFSFFRGARTFFFVDLARGLVQSVTTPPHLEAAKVSPDGHHVLLRLRRKTELRDLRQPSLPVLRELDGFVDWMNDETLVIRRSSDCSRLPCASSYALTTIAGPEAPVVPADCAPIPSILSHCLTPNHVVHELGIAAPVLQLGSLRFARWSGTERVGAAWTNEGKVWWIDLNRRLRTEISNKEAFERTHSFPDRSKPPEAPPDLDKEQQRTYRGQFLGKIRLFGEDDRFSLVRVSDGARLALTFEPGEGSAPVVPLWASDAGRFLAPPEHHAALSFAPRGRAGAGTPLSGVELAASCHDPELLRKLMSGEPLGCPQLLPLGAAPLTVDGARHP